MIYIDDQEHTAHKINFHGAQLANLLYAIGCKQDDVYAILLKNSVAFLECIVASRLSGVYYCPLNWHFKADEINYVLSDSAAKLLITTKELFEPIQSFIPNSIHVLFVDSDCNRNYDDALAKYPPVITSTTTPRAHMAYTSGTTGRPKGVIRLASEQQKILQRRFSGEQIVDLVYGIRKGGRALVTAPIYHSAPSLYSQVALRLASCFVVMTRFDPELFLRFVEKHRIEYAYMVPIMYKRLLDLPSEVRNKYDVSSLSFIVSTGAPCAKELKAQMMQWLGPIIYETYASSEAGLVTFATPEDALAKPGTAGRAVGDAVIKIYDEHKRQLGHGEVGYVYVHQPAYDDFTYRNKEQDRAHIEIDGFISLGDIGYLDEDGYLFIVDRSADLVLSGGVNLYPAEVESYLNQHPEVLDCVVFGVDDPDFGQQLAALVQVSPNNKALTALQLQHWLQQRITTFKVPREIHLITEKLRDENGKVSRVKARQRFLAGQASL